MKKVLASCLMVGLFAGAAYAGMPAATGVNGSLHDMNHYVNSIGGATYSDSMGRVCVFCHTPHNSTAAVDSSNYPLWNHDGVTANTTYTPYTWATPLNAGDGAANDFTIVGNQAIIGPSRLCLSCHDGTIAVDQHNGNGILANAAQAGANMISTRANIGTDLSNDHPIGFDYNAIRTYREAHSLSGMDAAGNREIVNSSQTFAGANALSAGAIVVPTADSFANQGVYNTVNRQDAGGRKIKDVLYQGTYMTCATCHEVHNKDNVPQAAYFNVAANNGPSMPAGTAPNYFLYAQEKDSAICLSCHVK